MPAPDWMTEPVTFSVRSQAPSTPGLTWIAAAEPLAVVQPSATVAPREVPHATSEKSSTVGLQETSPGEQLHVQLRSSAKSSSRSTSRASTKPSGHSVSVAL
jgi:hypothetical protein